jgi:hypothetical protein
VILFGENPAYKACTMRRLYLEALQVNQVFPGGCTKYPALPNKDTYKPGLDHDTRLAMATDIKDSIPTLLKTRSSERLHFVISNEIRVGISSYE